jgi:uncharacterized protein YdcH (DUF465 family)
MVKVGSREASPLVAEMEGLKQRHHELEVEIAELDRHLALSPKEQLDRVRLKKEKLRVKDRLLALAGDASLASAEAAPLLR